jgi:hypothetical protein
MNYYSLISSMNKAVANPYPTMRNYYKVDSNFNDYKGTENCTPTAITYASGKQNNCAVFNGSAYAMNVPIIAYGSFTISMWVKFSGTSERFFFSNKGTGGQGILSLATDSGKLFTRLRSNAGTGITSLYSTSNINSNTWRHVAMRFDISTGLQQCFVDGLPETSITYTGGSFSGLVNSTIGGEAQFGGGTPTYGLYNGNMDGIAIFTSALTDAEILAIYNIQNAGTDLI